MEQYHHALNLLAPMWRGLDTAYKRRYARNIWEQFSNAIRASAYTSSLPAFQTRLVTKLPIQLRADDLALVADVLTFANHQVVLHQLRTEIETIIALIRLDNERRKAEGQTE